jgi:hypothetical protein
MYVPLCFTVTTKLPRKVGEGSQARYKERARVTLRDKGESPFGQKSQDVVAFLNEVGPIPKGR